MTSPSKRRALFVALATLVPLVGGMALSDGDRDGDQDVARDAFQNSGTKPLVEILGTVEKQIDGDIVGVELEREHGRYIYELKIVTPRGRLLEVYVDAVTARILEVGED